MAAFLSRTFGGPGILQFGQNYNEVFYIAGYFLHLPAYDYADDYKCHPREEWDAITINLINIYGWGL